MKKIISALLAIAMIFTMTGCAEKKKKSDKLQIVTTLFPQYDFTKQIVGDKADVTLLLKPGVESHSYDPSPADVVQMNESDLFIYTGDNMETWAAKIIKTLDKSVSVLDVSKGITLVKTEEEHEDHGHDADEEEHEDHGHDADEEEHEDHGHDADEEEHEDHDHVYDPHIWTSPVNAKKMVNNILEELIKVDPDNEEYYVQNANDYLSKLTQLDTDIREVISRADIKTLYFAGKFAMYYFTEEYGLDYIAAFDSCSSKTEPSAKLVAKIVDAVKKDNAPVVFYEELSNHKAADTISKETGTKELLLHSCHNVSKDEFDNGASYLSLMQQNLENLKVGLYKNEK